MARMASIVMKQSEEPMLGPVELTVIAVSLIGVAVVIGRIVGVVLRRMGRQR